MIAAASEDDYEERISRTVFEVLAYQAGDDRVLTGLFERLYPRVLQMVRARMGPFLRQHAESSELVNETLMAAHKHLRTVHVAGSGALIHWLAAIAENVIRGRLDYLRARKRDPALEVELERLSSAVTDGEFEVQLDAGTPSPLRDAVGREELRQAVRCLEKLNEDQREALLLRRVAGAPLDFVAEQLKRSPQAVTKLVARAEAQLLECMLRSDA
jgi:RNA polymerase sigma factor (sigma-70 family)